MSLQKKCLTASAIAHGLVVLLVVVGSAFVPQQPKIDGPEFEIFDIPLDALVEEPNVISGNPNAGKPQEEPSPKQPEPVVPQPVPQPQPEVIKQPPKQPAPEPERIKTPEPNPFDLSKTKTVTTPEKEKPLPPSFDLAKAKRQKIETQSQPARTPDNGAADRAREAARIAQLLEGARKTVRNTGSRVGISYSDIIGPGGRAQMSYDLAVAKIYENEFKKKSVPNRGNEPAVEVEVTVRRDGTVMGDRITKRSGRAPFDRAVQEVLNTVKRNKVIPFPDDFKSETRTIRINFNLEDSLNNG